MGAVYLVMGVGSENGKNRTLKVSQGTSGPKLAKADLGVAAP